MFKTSNRGWGIRCLNDIPQGAFICIYAGSLLTEQMANEGGMNYGDEYLAELDYIEIVEKMKEDYEEEAYHSDGEGGKGRDDRSRSGSEDEEEVRSYRSRGAGRRYAEDGDFVPNFLVTGSSGSNSDIRTRLRRRNAEDEKKEESKKPASPMVASNADDDTVTISDDGL